MQPDNFTPQARTPWGGRRITERYKSGLVAPAQVGESWELSVESSFPSRLASGALLQDVIEADPEGLLGADRAKQGSTALLVKLLDAATPLSVQIHPADDHPGLAVDESGKPESWYVLDADEGAGLYLGLQEGVDERSMREALESGADVSDLLAFAPASPGDFFVIDAGTPHAIGGGLTLVEPQRVIPGRRGITYRYWDWNRRYTDGRPDPEGTPRELHVENALAVTDWDRPRAEALFQQARLRTGAPELRGPPRRRVLAGKGGLEFGLLGVERWAGTGTLSLEARPRLRALTVVAGTVRLGGVTLRGGESAALPAALPAMQAQLDTAHAILAWIP